MKIETKYDLGDRLWTVSYGKPVRFMVTGYLIMLQNDDREQKVLYTGTELETDDDKSSYSPRNVVSYENMCFRSRIALQKWLDVPFGCKPADPQMWLWSEEEMDKLKVKEEER